MSELRSLLDGLGERWEPLAPASNASIKKVERALKTKLPPDYVELLSLSDGGTATGRRCVVNFIPTDELATVDDEVVEKLPGMIPIADNGGGAFYLYDVEGKAARGEWTLLLVSMGTLSLSYARFVGASLTEMLGAISRGEDLEKRAVLGAPSE